MGDFDKNVSANDAAAKEKKKMMTVGVLAAVLLAVVGYQFMGKGPQAASASDVPDSPSIIPPQKTPAEALAALDPALDPTTNLLTGSATLPANLAEVPRNPFILSNAWRKELVKSVEFPIVHKNAESLSISVTHPTAPAVKAEDFKLTGIFHTDQRLYASINGSIVTVGSTVGNAKVLAITLTHVVLRHVDYPGGPTTTIKLPDQKFGN